MVKYSSSAAFTLGLIVATLAISQCYGQLYSDYYKGKCGSHDVEDIILQAVKAKYADEPDTVSDLIRLQFHDCVVDGCDGSIFIDGEDAEKMAEPNLSLGGFDTMDELKEIVEKKCPGVVSCADLLTIAARCAVFVAGGKWYYVETGRKDGYTSYKSQALAHVPKPSIGMHKAIELFASLGLSREDFVVLLGGHTVGTAHCDKFQKRLHNYKNTGKPDDRIPPTFLKFLKETCYQNTKVNNETFLDQTPNSHFTIDNDYYQRILTGEGILAIDANMATSAETNGIVKKLAYTPGYFLDKFGPAMVKLARVGVLTDNQGEVRKSCRKVNH